MKTISLLLSFAFICSSTFASDIVCPPDTVKSALVIIDMQPFFVKRGLHDQAPKNVQKLNQVLQAQIEAIRIAKKKKVPIIFLEYAGLPSLDQTNDRLKAEVSSYGNAKFFKKDKDGMFELENSGRDDLTAFLKEKNIGTLVITGANGGACVKESIIGSLQGNCNVVAYDKGIADFNYEDFIYPYKGHYSNIKVKCQNCSFREITETMELEQALADGQESVPKLDKGVVR